MSRDCPQSQVVAKKAKGMELPEEKAIQQHVIDSAESYEAKNPIGVKGEGAIAFGGGYTMSSKAEKLLKESDPAQFAAVA